MPIGDNNVSVSAVKSELGIASPDTVSGLVANANVNAWSFWSPRALYFDNLDNKILKEAPVPTASFPLGNFRRYNHSAPAPYVQSTTTNYIANPSDTTKSIAIALYNGEANIFRAASPSIPAGVRIRFYKTYSGGVLGTQVGSSVYIPFSDFGAAGGINGLTSIIRSIDASTPLSGHVVDETSTVANGPTAGVVRGDYDITGDGGIGTSNVTRYAEITFMASGGGTEIGRYPTYVASFQLRKYAEPDVSISTSSYSPNPFWEAGHTVSATAVIANGFTESHPVGTSNWNFSFKVAAIWNSAVQERVSGNVQIKYTWDGVDYNIGGVRAFSEGSTISVTDAVSGGFSAFAYDMVVPVKLYFTSLFTTYDAP